MTPSTFTDIFEVLSAARAKYFRDSACGVREFKTVPRNEENWVFLQARY